VPLGNTRVSPTTGGIINAAKGTNSNDLPLPLILSLAGLAILSALAAATVLRQRWPQARSAALRLLRR
jgi:predicted benzoate:H+ symporter BenE